MAREGAKKIILRYLKEHVNEEVPRKVLDDLVDHVGGWERSARTLRDDGYELIVNRSNNTYRLTSAEPVNEPRTNRAINGKLRAMIIVRDNSTCQMCGKTVEKDGIRIQIDHIVPFTWGGQTVAENLQCLCSECNEGKKNWVEGENPELMKKISAATSTNERLKLYFEFYANQPIAVDRLSTIAKTREWTRQLRYIRAEYQMDIEYIPVCQQLNRMQAYLYHKPGRKSSN